MFFYYPLKGAAASSALSIIVRPDPAENYEPSVYTTSSVAVRTIISGGVPPYIVDWTYVSGDTEIVPGTFQSETNVFHASPPGDSLSHSWTAVWQATVTDAASTTATDNVTVTLAVGTQPP